MEENYPVHVIGSKYFVLGFGGAGCTKIICEKPEEIFMHLKKGIYIIEPTLAKKVYGRLEGINTTDPEITIIVYGTDSLAKHMERATGIVLESGIA
jgi:vacuolar-type H+-ATPase subunit F/Vma7